MKSSKIKYKIKQKVNKPKIRFNNNNNNLSFCKIKRVSASLLIVLVVAITQKRFSLQNQYLKKSTTTKQTVRRTIKVKINFNFVISNNRLV